MLTADGFHTAGVGQDGTEVTAFGGLACVVTQAATGRVTLPAPALTARTRDPVLHDDHVPDLAGEPVVTALELATGDEPPTDAGAQTDEHHVVGAPAGAVPPLGEACDRVVVVHDDPQSRTGLHQLPQRQVVDIGEVGRRQQHTIAIDQARHRQAERFAGPEMDGDRSQRLDEFVWATRRGHPVLLDDTTLGVEGHPEALRAPDVDADCCGDHASARVFNSRTVLRMRTSARRLTKPGNGTTSSMVRS